MFGRTDAGVWTAAESNLCTFREKPAKRPYQGEEDVDG